MKRNIIITIALALATAPAVAQQQRFYGPDGRSLGTAVPLGHGSTRYYDRRGNSLGTSTWPPRHTRGVLFRRRNSRCADV